MAQMQKKGRLYLQAGALEYWICDEAQNYIFSAKQRSYHSLTLSLPSIVHYIGIRLLDTIKLHLSKIYHFHYSAYEDALARQN